MSVAAVSTVRNEEDIITATLLHLIAEGVDHIYLAEGCSTDSTRDQIRGVELCFPGTITVLEDSEPYHFQPRWMNQLAQLAFAHGHEWIVPFDADEFWYARSGERLADALERVSVPKLYVQHIQHRGWDYRLTGQHNLPKVAYRYEPGCWLANGNHEVTVGPAAWDVLELRELHYRGFKHFCRKVAERNATIDPSLPVTDGWHQRQYNGLSGEEMWAVWQQLQARETVFDPIPSRIPPAAHAELH